MPVGTSRRAPRGAVAREPGVTGTVIPASRSRREPPASSLRVWHALFWLARALALFLLPAQVEGREQLPRGGYMLVSNHIAWVDPPWIEFVVSRPIRYMGKRELFEVFVLGWLLRQIGVFPLTRDSADRRALTTALDFLGSGEVVGIFPEGHRSDTGALIRAHPGVGFLARRSGALVVPVAVSGSRAARIGKFWRRDVTIRFGRPFGVAEVDAADEQAVADAIMRRIAELLPPAQRGVYA